MSKTLNSGLSLTIPSAGETNWATLMEACFQKISEHDHTGNGKGALIAAAAIASDALTDEKIRLRNNQWLRARNAADTNDVNILRVTTGNVLELNLSIDGTSLSADSVNDEKIRLRNAQYLRARNAAGSGDINILRVNSSNLVEFATNLDGSNLAANSVALSKITNISTDRLLGRDTSGSGSPEQISLTGGLEFSGSTSIQVADLGITTAKVNADAVNDTKILLRNSQYLRARNAANNADINILQINSSDELQIAYGAALKLGAISSSNAYAQFNADVTINVTTGSQFKVLENGTTKVQYLSGALKPGSAQTVSLGDHSNPWTNSFVTGYAEMADGSAPSTPASGYIRIYSQSGVLKYKDDGGTVRTIVVT